MIKKTVHSKLKIRLSNTNHTSIILFYLFIVAILEGFIICLSYCASHLKGVVFFVQHSNENFFFLTMIIVTYPTEYV